MAWVTRPAVSTRNLSVGLRLRLTAQETYRDSLAYGSIGEPSLGTVFHAHNGHDRAPAHDDEVTPPRNLRKDSTERMIDFIVRAILGSYEVPMLTTAHVLEGDPGFVKVVRCNAQDGLERGEARNCQAVPFGVDGGGYVEHNALASATGIEDTLEISRHGL